MSALLVSQHVRLAEAGWRVVDSDYDDVRGVHRPQGGTVGVEQVALLECIECGAYEVHSWKQVQYRAISRCPHPMVDNATEYELDEICQSLVWGQGGMNLEEIGAVLDLSRERARQIQNEALEKLVGPLVSAGYDRETVMEHLRNAHATRPDSARQKPEWKLKQYRERYEAKRKAGRK